MGIKIHTNKVENYSADAYRGVPTKKTISDYDISMHVSNKEDCINYIYCYGVYLNLYICRYLEGMKISEICTDVVTKTMTTIEIDLSTSAW